MAMKHLLVFVVQLLVVTSGSDIETVSAQQESSSVVYMLDHCRHYGELYEHVEMVEDMAVIELTRTPRSVYTIKCLVTWAAPQKHQRLLLHFESMDVNYNPGTVDRLHIFDGASARFETQLSPPRGLYGKYFKGVYEFSSGGIHDYNSTGQAITLYFEGSPSPAFSGFRAILSVFTEPFANGTCEKGYVRCKATWVCIPSSLVCNSYQNCGSEDKSDLDDCGTTPPHNSNNIFGAGYTSDLGLMVGCAISIVILMIVVLWLGIVCIKRSKLTREGLTHRYQRRTGSLPEVEVDGTVVEPVHPRRFIAPILSFFEPPPLYSEESEHTCVLPSGPRFEPPPPYSLDERDTAGLLSNESLEERYYRPTHCIATQTSAPRPVLIPVTHLPQNNLSPQNLPGVHTSLSQIALIPPIQVITPQTTDEQVHRSDRGATGSTSTKPPERPQAGNPHELEALMGASSANAQGPESDNGMSQEYSLQHMPLNYKLDARGELAAAEVEVAEDVVEVGISSSHSHHSDSEAHNESESQA